MKHYRNGRFGGSFDSSSEIDLLAVLKWKLFPSKEPAVGKPLPLEVVRAPEELQQRGDFICWLSHASFLIQLGGKRIVIDPVFGDIPLYKRQIPAPYSVEELGRCDYLLISHVHYDHFDLPSLKRIEACSPRAIVPLQMSRLLQSTAPTLETVELDWYQNFKEDGLTITLLPAVHWGRRGLFDRNRVLWGSYLLQYGDLTIYFAGDSAKGDHFREIGRAFDIDYALLPVGAYRPEIIMKHNHLDPQEAFDAFEALGAKTMIPMHYGTYRLSDEPLDEPLEWIREIGKREPGRIHILKAGETVRL